MTFGLRATAIGSLALAIAAISFGQLSQDYRAIITKGGQFKILYNSQQVMLLRFGLFYDGWNEYRQQDMGLQGDGSYLGWAGLNPGDLNVNTFLTLNGNAARLTIVAVPTRNLTANSAHLNVRFDPYFWGGATFTSNDWTSTLPRRLDQSIYKTGYTNKYTVTANSGFQMVVQSASGGNYALRDSRQYNIGFELRAWETSGTWLAGVPKTYNVDLTPSVAMPIGPDAPITVVQDSNWVPVDQKLTVTTGSALDWSKPNPVYAGSKGWLKVSSSGKFYLENEPNTPVRFYGTNLAGSACFPDHPAADALADTLWRRGYNAIRMHGWDDLILDPGAADSTTLSAYWSDNFMYLIEALKKKGIYVALDMYTMRHTKTDEVLPGATLDYPNYKAGLLAVPSIRQNFLTFSENVLNLYNTYASKKLKDDPGIAWISLCNENNPMWEPSSILRSEIVSALNTAVGGTWDVSNDAGARAADTLLQAEYDYFNSVLRNDGVKALTSTINSGEQTAVSRTRSRCDFVEDHVYYAIPVWLAGRHNTPFQQTPVPPIASIRDFGRYSAARIDGKAFVVGETNACAPNPYRGEFGLFMGALASVQQWDAMFRFNFMERPQQGNTVMATEEDCTLTDPAAVATERALVALYGRGDITCNDAKTVIHAPWDQVGLNENKDIPLVKNCALKNPMSLSHSVGAANPATTIQDGISWGAGGQVVADLFKQFLKINTPRTAGMLGNPGLKEVQNTGTTWDGAERLTVTSRGTLPHLARIGSASIKLQLDSPSTAVVYRLDLSGQRIGTVPVTASATDISFTATTKNPADGRATIFYEIVQ
jgi:hypothetical protein